MILCTAGHVDHGKSSLLRVLTGQEPSRLSQELKRGMSMQLGHIWLQAPDGRYGIVDVPGHSDYRTAMLRGISQADFFIFVVAADDGWMPQSQEHLDALVGFGVDRGIVVVTKSDLVSQERMTEITEELQLRFIDAFDAEFKVLAFSSVESTGQEELRESLLEVLQTAMAQPVNRFRRKPPTLSIDRCFTLSGLGTVIAGTLRHGDLKIGDKIVNLTTGAKAEIKSIEQYKESCEIAAADTRVALGLKNAALSDFPTNSQTTLQKNDTFLHKSFDVRFKVDPAVKIHQRPTAIHLIHAGREIAAKYVLNHRHGHDCILRIHSQQPEQIFYGDKLLMLSSGHDKVFGAGEVLDEAPSLGLKASLSQLQQQDHVSLQNYVAQEIKKRQAIDIRQLDSEALEQLMPSEEEDKDPAEFILVNPFLTRAAEAKIVLKNLQTYLEEFHQKNPYAQGCDLKTLSRIFKYDAKFLAALLTSKELAAKEQFVLAGTLLRLRVFKAPASTPFIKELMKLVAAEDGNAFTLGQLPAAGKNDRAAIQVMVDQEKLVRLDPKTFLSMPAYQKLESQIVEYLRENQPAPITAIRDHVAVGRKFLTQILDTMDTRKITVFDGETRQINPAYLASSKT